MVHLPAVLAWPQTAPAATPLLFRLALACPQPGGDAASEYLLASLSLDQTQAPDWTALAAARLDPAVRLVVAAEMAPAGDGFVRVAATVTNPVGSTQVCCSLVRLGGGVVGVW